MYGYDFFNIFAYISVTITLKEEFLVDKLSRIQKLVKFKKSASAFDSLELLWSKEEEKDYFKVSSMKVLLLVESPTK